MKAASSAAVSQGQACRHAEDRVLSTMIVMPIEAMNAHTRLLTLVQTSTDCNLAMEASVTVIT